MILKFLVLKSAKSALIGLICGLLISSFFCNLYRNDIRIDTHFINDVRQELSQERSKLLCWIMTYGGNHRVKADMVKQTWVKRCDKYLFMSDTPDEKLPTIVLDQSLKGRENLTKRTMKTFDYIYDNFVEKYDWFLKADDDTYIIVENLKKLLSSNSPEQPIFFGQQFHNRVHQGYFSGGAGYVVSKEGLLKYGKRKTGFCNATRGAEDVNFGKCMQELGVIAGDTFDENGKSRFHCFKPTAHLNRLYPKWYASFSGENEQKNMSNSAISFHYMKASDMRLMDYLIYDLKVG